MISFSDKVIMPFAPVPVFPSFVGEIHTAASRSLPPLLMRIFQRIFQSLIRFQLFDREQHLQLKQSILRPKTMLVLHDIIGLLHKKIY